MTELAELRIRAVLLRLATNPTPERVDEALPELLLGRFDAIEAALREETQRNHLAVIQARMEQRATGAISGLPKLLRPPFLRYLVPVGAIVVATVLILVAIYSQVGNQTPENLVDKEPAPKNQTVPPNDNLRPDVDVDVEPAPGIRRNDGPQTGRDEGLLAQRVELGTFIAVVGEPTVTALGTRRGEAALPKMAIYSGTRIETGDADMAEIQFADGTTLQLDYNTTLELPSVAATEGQTVPRPAEIRLPKGRILARVTHSESEPFVTKTPVATAEVLGTEFALAVETVSTENEGPGQVSNLRAVLQVKSGRVAFYNDFGRVLAEGSFETVAMDDAAPTEPRRITRVFRVPSTKGSGRYAFIEAKKISIRSTPQALAIEQGTSGMGLTDMEGLPHVVEVQQSSPAERAGLQLGDRILAVNGVAGLDSQTIWLTVLRSSNTSLKLTISRNGQQTFVQMTPESAQIGWLPDPPKPGDPVYEATWLMFQGDLAEAESELKQLLAREPSAAAHNNLGVLYELNERYRSAISHYQQAVRLAPGVLRYRDNLGHSLFRIGNFRRSLEERILCARLAPGHPNVLANLAETHQALGRSDEALRILDGLLERQPNSSVGWLAKSMVLMQVDKAQEALACAKRALELAPFDPHVMHQAAFTLQLTGNMAEAEAMYRRIIDLNQFGAAQSEENLVVLLKDLKRYEEAETILRKRIAENPDNAGAFSSLGTMLAYLHRYSEAETAFRRSIELDPNSVSAYGSLGSMLGLIGRYDEAEKAARRAIELDPGSAGGHIGLGEILFRRGRHESGLAEYRLAIELEPGLAYTYGQLGTLLCRLGRFEEAEPTLRRAIELDPLMYGAYSDLGFVLHYTDRLEEAEKMYRRAIELNPKFASAYINLGNLLSSTRRGEEGVPLIQRGIELMPPAAISREELATAYLNLGSALIRLGRLQEAEASFRQAIVLNPTDSHVYHILGYVLALLGRYEESENAFDRSFELDKTCMHAYIQVFDLYRVLERFSDAERAMRMAVRLDPKSQLAYHNLAFVVAMQGRADEAEPIWRRAVELGPGNARPMSTFARSLADRGTKLDEALQLAQRAVAIAPQDGSVLRNLGWVHFKRRELDRAEEALTESIALDGDSQAAVPAWRDLGSVYQKQMQTEKAMDAYRRAIVLDPKNTLAHHYLAKLLVGLDRLEEADSLYASLMAALPIQPSALNNYALHLAERNAKLDEALAMAQRNAASEPANAYYAETLGWVLFKLGRMDDSEAALKKAVELFGPNNARSAESWHKLGHIYEKQGDREAAIAAYRSALDADPTDEVAIQALRRLGG